MRNDCSQNFVGMSVSRHRPDTANIHASVTTFFATAALAKSSSVTSRKLCCVMRGELLSQEQTTCNGNSRWSSVCLLARIEWNNRGQPETPARRRSRVNSLLRFAFLQPIAVLAAARYWGAATTYSLLPLNHGNNPCDAKMNRVRMLVAGHPRHTN